MKKIFGATWLCLVLFGITFLPIQKPLYAAVPAKSLIASVTPSPTPIPTPIEYVLPFPGILPTHPLYWFKALRDRIIEILVTDPVSKAEFYILQADKKLNMAVALTTIGKVAEARAAFTQALVSRSQAITLVEAQSTQGGSSIPGHLTEKLLLSLAKHKEVLVTMDGDIAPVDVMIARVASLSGSVSK